MDITYIQMACSFVSLDRLPLSGNPAGGLDRRIGQVGIVLSYPRQGTASRRDCSVTVPFPTPVPIPPTSLSRSGRRRVAQVFRHSCAVAGGCRNATKPENHSLRRGILQSWRLGRFTSQAESRGKPQICSARVWRSSPLRVGERKRLLPNPCQHHAGREHLC